MPECATHFPVDEFPQAKFHSAGTVVVGGNQAGAGSMQEGLFFPGKTPTRHVVIATWLLAGFSQGLVVLFMPKFG
jgi:hypothetical protein